LYGGLIPHPQFISYRYKSKIIISYEYWIENANHVSVSHVIMDEKKA
jgi:hypothetical protein